MKPTGKAQGKGIFLVNKLAQVHDLGFEVLGLSTQDSGFLLL